ncbi:MAG: hypothetical protein JKY94_00495 [Rhodobacteraceae bacterium]|nr:hypothetical protein [Paracoccaceae bacterium]
MVFAGLISLDINGFYVGFVLLPVLAIYFWPLEASHSWSLVCIFILGFFHDVASNGPFGVWTLSYLILFIVLDGGVSIKHGFRNNFGGYVMTLAFAIGLAYVFGAFALGHAPGMKILLTSVLTAILAFPFVYWIRRAMQDNHAADFSSGGTHART